ncbi:hypothetical protein HPB47_011538 [Ixodes persulcatus]|uniref:Uncharacterized protein n=1 Tax=Ixodes persulcatus TaxID=34615 RepID=A0AC60NW20_IXOPE|nr:hypothetical protein HPB47_011538 [Ixodes persulcatus]
MADESAPSLLDGGRTATVTAPLVAGDAPLEESSAASWRPTSGRDGERRTTSSVRLLSPPRNERRGVLRPTLTVAAPFVARNATSRVPAA